MSRFPLISFAVDPRQKADWLFKKNELLKKKWHANNDGKRLLKKIMRMCNLEFPRDFTAIRVVMKEYSQSRYGDLLAYVDVQKPRKIIIFAKKNARYSNSAREQANRNCNP